MITGYEMVWACRYFQHRAETWKEHALGPKAATAGHQAYACRQAAFWEKLGVVAWNSFQAIKDDLDLVFGAHQPGTSPPPPPPNSAAE